MNQFAPVILVGVKGECTHTHTHTQHSHTLTDDDQYSFRRTVREGQVKKTAELLEKCTEIDVGLSQQSSNALFAQGTHTHTHTHIVVIMK